MSIHPTAIVHPDARLGSGVVIGPYAVIEGAAVIGDGCTIQAHAIIGAHVTMGQGNVIGYGAVIGGDPQDFAFRSEIQSEVRIGNRNRIREYCTLHRGTAEGSATVVGDDCFLMAGAHLAHNVHLGNRVILANNALLGGHVLVEDGVFIGGGCVFHQHIRVGRLAIAQGASAFSKDIPPFTLAAERNTVVGLNVIGLKRAGFTSEQRREVKAAFNLLYRSGLNIRQAIETAGERTWGNEAAAFLDFVAAAKKRGVCALLRSVRTGKTELDAD
ncbi:acyl-ACP--UDP-N-acetylglucosamine O-acyltransferase [Verrucomicrobiota bacterium sgz303538]